MERLVVGDIVTLPFPYKDGLREKNRPALVIATPDEVHAVLCQITSSVQHFPFSVEISAKDFEVGALNSVSRVRADIIFSIEISVINKVVGRLRASVLQKVVDEINTLIRVT